MERTAVTSDSLAEVGYDRTSQTLEIEFTNGRVYRYPGVPRFVAEALLRADSHGQYFNRIIRPRYDGERVV